MRLKVLHSEKNVMIFVQWWAPSEKGNFYGYKSEHYLFLAGLCCKQLIFSFVWIAKETPTSCRDKGAQRLK
jgi:hypothetical protein